MYNKTVLFNQQQLDYPPPPLSKEAYHPQKCHEQVVAYPKHPLHVLVKFFLQYHTPVYETPRSKQVLSLLYCEHFQREICMHASIYTKPTMDSGLCPSHA